MTKYNGMKKAMMACCVMLLTSMLLPSCLGDDDDVTVYDDVAITSVTLGTLNRYLTTTASDGTDSVYKRSFAGSTIRLVIDQIGHRIFCANPLPMGTDLKHVVCTLTTKNNAIVAEKSITSDSMRVVSSTDSLDFSVPRTLRVYATDGEHYRDYVMTLTVREQEVGTLVWTADDEAQMPEAMAIDNIDMSRLDADASLVPTLGLTGVTWQGRGNVEYTLWAGLTAETDTAMTLWRRLRDEGHEGQWVLMTQAEDNPYYLPASTQVALAYVDGYLLALSSNGTIYRSQDQGITWRTDEKLQMPEGFQGAPMTVISDGSNVWLQDGGGKKWSGAISN